MTPVPTVAPAPWTVRTVLGWTRARFEERGIDSARLDAEVLLAHALGTTRMQLYLDMDKPLSQGELTACRVLVKRRSAREPVSLILGNKEFYGRPFKVTADTLTPRPETELLVDEVLHFHKRFPVGAILDVGTGTGCLAVTLQLEIPAAAVTAVDISTAALQVARHNAAQLGAKVDFVCSDLCTALPRGARFDVVVSNPPYLTAAEWTAAPPEVHAYEPELALTGHDPDGLGHHRALAATVLGLLGGASTGHGGLVLVELGSLQGPAALDLWRTAAGAEPQVTLLKDWEGRDRVIRVEMP